MLKIALINGSPKAHNSASEIIANALQGAVGASADCLHVCAMKQNSNEILDAIEGCDALVFFFPLYVDGIPSHLLRFLDETQTDIAKAASGAMVYAVVNNGFYEGHQNTTAFEIMRHFTVCAGLKWGQGIGVGAGGMIHAAPVGRGPMKNLGRAIDRLAASVLNAESADDYTFEPNFPRFLYNAIAHFGWRSQSRKNGLKQIQRHPMPSRSGESFADKAEVK
jgi:multimeric flavodoxin WrbA